MTQVPTVSDFILRGFFPKELPPNFLSQPASPISVSSSHTSFPTAKMPWRDLTSYDLARPGGLRRRLSIIHPEPFLRLSAQITDNWATLSKIWDASPIGMSKPTQGLARAIKPSGERSHLREQRLALRAQYPVYVVTDITSCYPSMYTHSISWAIHGRSFIRAGRMHDLTLVGNRIDKLVQAAQSGQTNGLPVGPDTSHVLAELILSQVDVLLATRLGSKIAGFRYFDDYELYFKSRAEAERGLACLELALDDFALSLNRTKTRIVELPSRFEDQWQLQLEHIGSSLKHKSQRDALVHLFNEAFALRASGVGESVVNFAIGISSAAPIKTDCWPWYQNLLLQCIASEPSTIGLVSRELLRHKSRGDPVDTVRIGAILQDHVVRSASIRKSHEVCWALWLLQALGCKAKRFVIKAVLASEDPCAIASILLLYGEGSLSRRSLLPAEFEEVASRAVADQQWWLVLHLLGTDRFQHTDAIAQIHQDPVLSSWWTNKYELLHPKYDLTSAEAVAVKWYDRDDNDSDDDEDDDLASDADDDPF